MATITKTPAGTFRAIIRTKNKTITKTFKLRKLSKAWALRIEGDEDLMAATGCKGASIPFSQLADEYIDQWTGKSRITDKVRFWKMQLGDTPLIKITGDQLQTILDDYEAGEALCGIQRSRTGRKRAPATINRMRAQLSSIFKYAVKKRRYLKKNPVIETCSLIENNEIVRFLSEEERTNLLKACRASSWEKLYLLVLLALTTGARQGELLGLHWDEIDFQKRTATLPTTKNGQRRILTIPKSTMSELQRLREVGAGLIFPSPTKWRKPFEFRKPWLKAVTLAGIENFRFHDLRHSAASYLVMAGATLHETAEVLGHRSIQTTRRYAHLSIEHKQSLTDRVLGGFK